MNDGERTEKLPAIQAVYRSIATRAMEGHRFSQTLGQQIETADREARATQFNLMVAYKTQWDSATRKRRANGWPEPAPLPHPDDIIIDLDVPRAIIAGPKTEAEKAELDAAIGQRICCNTS